MGNVVASMGDTRRATILLAGGGTGGHLYPGIAVVEALARVAPDIEPVFLCTQRPIDKVILEPMGYRFIPQPIVPPVRTISGLLKFWKSWRDTKDLMKAVLRDNRVVGVLGLGGYAAGVAVKLGAQAGIPAAIINPDVVPGKANQFLLQYVRYVCCQFEATRSHVAPAHQSKIVVTGCPIRASVAQLPPKDVARAKLGLEKNLQTLVITGASQGSLTVNEGSIETLRRIKLQGWQVLHLAGREHATTVRDAYRDAGLAQVARVVDFTADMHDVWAAADLAISRAGASSCAELTACGVPSVLMPYPYHKDMHQRHNAKVLEDAGAAVTVDDAMDKARNAERLQPVMEGLIYDSPRRAAMAEAARKIGMPRAAENVAQTITQMLSDGR